MGKFRPQQGLNTTHLVNPSSPEKNLPTSEFYNSTRCDRFPCIPINKPVLSEKLPTPGKKSPKRCSDGKNCRCCVLKKSINISKEKGGIFFLDTQTR